MSDFETDRLFGSIPSEEHRGLHHETDDERQKRVTRWTPIWASVLLSVTLFMLAIVLYCITIAPTPTDLLCPSEFLSCLYELITAAVVHVTVMALSAFCLVCYYSSRPSARLVRFNFVSWLLLCLLLALQQPGWLYLAVELARATALQRQFLLGSWVTLSFFGFISLGSFLLLLPAIAVTHCNRVPGSCGARPVVRI